jgi:hypothetical protein
MGFIQRIPAPGILRLSNDFDRENARDPKLVVVGSVPHSHELLYAGSTQTQRLTTGVQALANG